MRLDMWERLAPRRALAVGIGFALAAVASATALAAEEADKGRAAASPFSNQVVVRDPESGQLRPPSAEEEASLNAHARSSAARGQSQPQPRSHASGARGTRLTDEFMSYSIMVRQPDGRLVEFCFPSREVAEEALRRASAPASPTNNLPTE